MIRSLLASCLLFIAFVIQAQPVVVEERGPWSLHAISDGVWNIQDYNSGNPRGIQLDSDGNRAGMNNTSDIYLVVGSEKAMMIDMSNPVSWDDTAAQSLHDLVYGVVGSKPLYISATHFHGDHLGMAPVFIGDVQARFWLSEGEFSALDKFPDNQTTWTAPGASMDLGGITVDTMELPGHTPHSTLFFIKDKYLVFTGDAMGSGIGVWLFDYDSFLVYRESVDRLINTLEDAAFGIDTDALRIHSAHSWQYPGDELTMQYIYDMRTLIDLMGRGLVKPEDYSVPIPFLDATFTYGVATITWNKAAASRFQEETASR